MKATIRYADDRLGPQAALSWHYLYCVRWRKSSRRLALYAHLAGYCLRHKN